MPYKEQRKGQREREKRAKRYSPTRRRNQQPEMNRKKWEAHVGNTNICILLPSHSKQREEGGGEEKGEGSQNEKGGRRRQ